MNNAERGLFIIDYFTELQEEVVEIGGEIDQGKMDIDVEPTCNTVACIGGWIANKEQVPTEYSLTGYRVRSFNNGVKSLAEKLGFDANCLELEYFVEDTKLWHNAYSSCLFDSTSCAYGYRRDYEFLGIEEVCDYWILFGYDLLQDSINKEDKE